MRARPILFSAPMIRALLAGRKTQTRRAIAAKWWRCLDADDEDDRALALAQSPYAPGEHLWVKEAIRRVGDGLSEYVADGAITKADAWPWKRAQLPAMFCPKGLSRITLEITEARIERVQDISGYDAVAEGISILRCGCEVCRRTAEMCPADQSSAIMEYASLWESLNGKRPGLGWGDNPWCWCISFKVLRQEQIANEARR